MLRMTWLSRARRSLPALRRLRRGGCRDPKQPQPEASAAPEPAHRAARRGAVERRWRPRRRRVRPRSVTCPRVEMAGIFKSRTRLHLLPSFGRSLPREFSARLWKREGMCLPRCFRTHTSLQPQRWQPDSVNFYPGTGLALHRCAGSLSPTNRVLEKSMIENKEQFKLVYKFPGIKYCRIFSRMKLLQTGITIVILPPVYHLYLQEQVSQDFLLYVTGIACFASVMLYGISYFLRRMIGLMYLNEAGTIVKVAHLTFWGKKKEIYCPVKTVMMLGDTGDAKNEVLLQFKQHNSTQVLYFTLKFGHIVDKQRFAQIFGGF
ncbi:transmembrane protein 186 [Dermochelys coriacea]|uniref:transmembrane protein 186 n=1 Tax=Dermochelys coriacea TaxID=27794 RepID=UPI0018E726BB|nr:transmembrane protein 186 [Dermochelys coriacea]